MAALNSYYNNIRRAAIAAEAIDLLSRQRSRAAYQQKFDDFFGTDDGDIVPIRVVVGIDRPSPSRGGIRIEDGNGNVGLFFRGVNSSTVGDLIEGYASNRRMLNNHGFNSAASATFFSRFIHQGSFLNTRGKRYFIYGHSGGGVLAEALAFLGNWYDGAQIAEITTYGAPKPGVYDSCYRAPHVLRNRWMMANDPVPAIPYSVHGTSVAIALHLFGTDYKPEVIRHGPGGHLLYADGSSRELDDTTSSLPTTGLRIGSWLVGTDASQGYPHSISTYAAALRAKMANLPGDEPLPTPPPLPPRPLPPRVLIPVPMPIGANNVNPDVVVITPNGAALPDGSKVGTHPNEVNEMSQAKVAPRLRVSAQRSGGVWLVLWDDVILAQCSFGSKAKTIASSVNRMCRVFGKADSISSASVQAYVAMFFAAAAVPGGGVAPPMNVT